jgi:hypothetical protein
MTAIFIIRRRDECHSLTDGAAIDPDGRVVAIIAKAMPLPHLGVAVTLRGTVEMMTQLPLLGTAPDLSALRSRAESAVQACEGQVEVYVAGVEACFAVTAGAGVQDILGFALAPSSDAIYADLGFLWDRPPMTSTRNGTVCACWKWQARMPARSIAASAALHSSRLSRATRSPRASGCHSASSCMWLRPDWPKHFGSA